MTTQGTSKPAGLDAVARLARHILGALDVDGTVASGWSQYNWLQIELALSAALRLRGIDATELTASVLEGVRVDVSSAYGGVIPYAKLEDFSVFRRLVRIFQPLPPPCLVTLCLAPQHDPIRIVFHAEQGRARAYVLDQKDHRPACYGVALDFMSASVDDFALTAGADAAVEVPLGLDEQAAGWSIGRAIMRRFAAPLYHGKLLFGFLRPPARRRVQPVLHQGAQEQAHDVHRKLRPGDLHARHHCGGHGTVNP